MSRFLMLLGVLTATAWSPLCQADDAKDPAAAEALFRQGREAVERQDFATACSKFRESNRLDPAVGTVFNIAHCEERLGHLATSWTLFQDVIQRLPTDDDRRGIAEQRSRALDARLPRLTIRLSDDAQGRALVRRDGVELGKASLDTALPVDPGEHSIAVEAAGHVAAEYKTRLKEGENATLSVAPGASLPPERKSTPPLPSEQPASHGHGLAYALGGVGIAGLVTGTIAGVLVLERKATVDDECQGHACSRRGLDAANSGKTLGVITTVGLAVGLAGLGASTYLFVSSPAKRETASLRDYTLGLRGTW